MTRCICGTDLPPADDREAWAEFTPGCRFCERQAVTVGFQHIEE